jgi:CheY-like chemotaxis protein
VLIVDSEELMRRALARALSKTCEVCDATSGERALARLGRGESFDVIVCNLHMTPMNGRDFHDRIREKYREHALRVVFVTDGVSDFSLRAYVEFTPNRVLKRPIDLHALEKIIDERARGMLAAQ